jgi:hypothetical protein
MHSFLPSVLTFKSLANPPALYMLELQTSVTVKISYHKEKRSTYHILENITGNSLAPGHICTYTIAGVVGMVRT